MSIVGVNSGLWLCVKYFRDDCASGSAIGDMF